MTPVDGILNLLKPPGMTSHDVVSYVKRVLKIKKIGHTGTLDPGAAGVLPICMGRATKAVDYIMEKEKKYRAEITFGVVTDTQDSYGEVLCRMKPEFSSDRFHEVLKSFTGEIEQVPPMYSAVKHEGRKLYELAREGISVERKPRKVYIKSIVSVHSFLPDRAVFDVECSKGTYIRALCHDIGEKLGCGAHMSFLLRTRSGTFTISDALTLEELEWAKNSGDIDSHIIKVDGIFAHLPYLTLTASDEDRFENGADINLEHCGIGGLKQEHGLIRVYQQDSGFMGLGRLYVSNDRKYLKQEKLFRLRCK